MYRITLLVAAICFISVAYGTECSSGPGYRFPITCPGLLDPKKSYCCEIGGSFRCCDQEEFALQDQEYTDNIEPGLAPRYKRDYITNWADNNYVDAAAELSTGAIIGICVLAIIPVALICCCCCCCCACCPCYHWCHPNSTNVTIVQPGFGYPGNNGPNNFGGNPSTQSAMPQDSPPQYVRGGYSKLEAPSDRATNYIQ